MNQSVPVELGSRSYEVRIGPGRLDELGVFAAEAAPDAATAVVISDSNVAPLHARRAMESLQAAEMGASLLEFPAGEANKTLATCGRLYESLFALEPRIDRRTLIVALGGGVTGDLAGFVAATALRGLRWMQCPTSLLADVDASVGGKTGVDSPAGKNLIGAFHQPRGVLIDVGCLRTLPAAELDGGLAECVKHAVIRDVGLLDFLEDSAGLILACDGEAMTELVAWNVRIKAAVVSADERESGERAHLNFGHTIGHAIETLLGYGKISHGQAVSLGMAAACRIAAGRGLIEEEAAGRVESLLKRFGLPVRWAGLDGRRIWDIMQHDKKALAGQVRMVLPVTLGAAAVFDDITPQIVLDAVRALAS